MAKTQRDALFLDTSIQIARLVHGPRMKERIEERIARHSETCTGLVARQEFKRRLLKEAQYLIKLLHQYKSYGEVLQHLIRLPGQYSKMVRKKNICLQTLAQIHGGSDKELTERLQLYLHTLLTVGLKRFDQSVDRILRDTGCACALTEVVTKTPLRRYELGPERCSRARGTPCSIVTFLRQRKDARDAILQKIASLPPDQKTKELGNAETFLRGLNKDDASALAADPCLTVGDLLIALESVGFDCFFTLNGAESRHLCRALKQTLVLRPIDPTREDEIYSKDAAEWPGSGTQGQPREKTDPAD